MYWSFWPFYPLILFLFLRVSVLPRSPFSRSTGLSEREEKKSHLEEENQLSEETKKKNGKNDKKKKIMKLWKDLESRDGQNEWKFITFGTTKGSLLKLKGRNQEKREKKRFQLALKREEWRPAFGSIMQMSNQFQGKWSCNGKKSGK